MYEDIENETTYIGHLVLETSNTGQGGRLGVGVKDRENAMISTTSTSSYDHDDAIYIKKNMAVHDSTVDDVGFGSRANIQIRISVSGSTRPRRSFFETCALSRFLL